MPKRFVRLVGLFLVVVCCIPTTPFAYAQSTASPNYHFEESTIGAGGLLQSNSANFQGQSSVGDIGIGNSASPNFQVDAGSQTTNDPRLAISVNQASSLGIFSPTTTATATSTFTVLNYTSSGYIVTIAGTPPTHDGHSIAPMTADNTDPAAASTTSFEQFGINLKANTTPNVGANPVNGLFAFGANHTQYDIADRFRFVSGETIAVAPKSSGTTTYTISYIVNVGALTPGGHYTSAQTLIVTGTY